MNKEDNNESSYGTFCFADDKKLEELTLNTQLDSKTKILIVLESEYKYLEISQNNIIYSNNEMKRLMPDDKDIIESISINEKFFKKNLERMIQIKKRISLLEGNNHYICKKALPSLPK